MMSNDIVFTVGHLGEKYDAAPFTDEELNEIAQRFTLDQQQAIIQLNSKEWISVKDEIPNNDDGCCSQDTVLVCALEPKGGPSILYGIAQFIDGKWKILGEEGAHSCTGFYTMTSEMVTHWREFPDEPLDNDYDADVEEAYSECPPCEEYERNNNDLMTSSPVTARENDNG